MPKKRITSPDDLERLKENLLNNFGEKITDRGSFEMAWIKYLGQSHDISDDNKDKVFNKIRKELNLEPEKRAEIIARKRVARKKKVQRRADLNVLAVIRQARVFAAEETITRRKQRVTVLRDKKGRFAKRIK